VYGTKAIKEFYICMLPPPPLLFPSSLCRFGSSKH